MLAVTKVAEPCLQGRRVVLADDIAVGLDGCMTRYGCPLARIVNEAHVNRSVFLQIIGFSRLGVGVEKDIEAVSFLGRR